MYHIKGKKAEKIEAVTFSDLGMQEKYPAKLRDSSRADAGKTLQVFFCGFQPIYVLIGHPGLKNG